MFSLWKGCQSGTCVCSSGSVGIALSNWEKQNSCSLLFRNSSSSHIMQSSLWLHKSIPSESLDRPVPWPPRLKLGLYTYFSWRCCVLLFFITQFSLHRNSIHDWRILCSAWSKAFCTKICVSFCAAKSNAHSTDDFLWLRKIWECLVHGHENTHLPPSFDPTSSLNSTLWSLIPKLPRLRCMILENAKTFIDEYHSYTLYLDIESIVDTCHERPVAFFRHIYQEPGMGAGLAFAFSNTALRMFMSCVEFRITTCYGAAKVQGTPLDVQP